MARWKILLILALIAIANSRQTLSAPTNWRLSGSSYEYETTTNSPYGIRWPTTSTATTGAATQDGDFSWRLASSPAPRSHNDYIVSENEYQQILIDYFQAERETSIVSNPRNYVPDTVSMEEILRMIEGGSSSPTAALVIETTTTTGSNSESPVTAETINAQANHREDLDANGDRARGGTILTTGQPEVARHESECSICHEQMARSQLVTLFCGHEYHIDCIRRWRFESFEPLRCPMCLARDSSSSSTPVSSNIELTTEMTGYASVVTMGDGESPPSDEVLDTTTWSSIGNFNHPSWVDNDSQEETTPVPTQEEVALIDDCSICLEQMDTSEDVATLSCGHKFHADCIRRWKYQTIVPSIVSRHRDRSFDEVQVMELGAENGFSDTNLKSLIDNIRSENEAERKQTILQIPTLILRSLQHGEDILKQLLLVIYNLHTNSENFEILNANNRIRVFRHLLRLYIETMEETSLEQIDALIKLIDLVHSSELLVELAYVLHKCSEKQSPDNETDDIQEALDIIREKAAASLSSQALLMIHSIVAMK